MSKRKNPDPRSLLRWWDKARRPMPWRAEKGQKTNPYHELVSEFMLQQTTVAAVIPYFNRFIRRWPHIRALARAELEEVRAQWAGLGYYRRAAFLHACARAIVKEHKGFIPQDEETLRTLPGIGAYTAAAIAAIAFNRKATVVDGNVERVIARVFAIEEKLPAARSRIKEHAESLLPHARFGDYAQALMELGATLCTPRNPSCPQCPWQKNCKAHALGAEQDYPRKTAKKKNPHKQAAVFIVLDPKGRVLLRRRPEKGLYAGLWEFPSTPWQEKAATAAQEKAYAPFALSWRQVKQPVAHVFSHFTLSFSLRLGHTPTTIVPDDGEYRWSSWRDVPHSAMPSLMLKVAKVARKALAPDDE